MEIDPNSWYHLKTGGAPVQFLAGTHPYIAGNEGLISLSSLNDSSAAQKWQFLPQNSSTYLLRTKASGPNGYLATSGRNQPCENAIPIIYNISQVDETMLWNIQLNDDKTVQLKNNVPGRSCYLKLNEERLQMSSNNTSGLIHFASPVAVGRIDDPKSSNTATESISRVNTTTISTPAFVSSALVRSINSFSTSYSHAPSFGIPLPTSTPLPPSPSPSPPLEHSSRLSPSTAMGVGVVVGM